MPDNAFIQPPSRHHKLLYIRFKVVAYWCERLRLLQGIQFYYNFFICVQCENRPRKNKELYTPVFDHSSNAALIWLVSFPY